MLFSWYRSHLHPYQPLQLFYQEWCSGTIPILLLHGLGDDCSVWTHVAQSLDHPFHCVAPDLRSGTSRIFEATAIIPRLQELMEHLQWSSTHVIAHSWGGKVAAIWATQSPQHFRSLVLVDPVLGFTQPVAIPSLFLQPEEGFNRTQMHLQPYRTHLQDFTIQAIPGNHWSFFKEPEIFSAIVKTFILEQN